MNTIQTVFVTYTEIEADIFVVEAKAIDGRWFQHEGPKGFPYFTAEQAKRLAGRVRGVCRIDPKFWTAGSGGYYGTAAHEYALLETEYYEG